MGISGTQVARNASDIVLLDDNFASFVRAIEWGRNILDCVRKFLQFQLAVNAVAIVAMFFGSVFYNVNIFSAVQLLWVNLVMDSLGALALASDEPDKEILSHPPHKRNGNLITRDMFIYIMYIFTYEFLALIAILEIVPFSEPSPKFYYRLEGLPSNKTTSKYAEIEASNRKILTLVFTTFILLQMMNMITCRQLEHEINIFKNFFSNKIFLSMMACIGLVQTLVVQFGQDFTATISLDARGWAICLATSVLLLPYVFLVRCGIYLVRSRKKVHAVEASNKDKVSIEALEREEKAVKDGAIVNAVDKKAGEPSEESGKAGQEVEEAGKEAEGMAKIEEYTFAGLEQRLQKYSCELQRNQKTNTYMIVYSEKKAGRMMETKAKPSEKPSTTENVPVPSAAAVSIQPALIPATMPKNEISASVVSLVDGERDARPTSADSKNHWSKVRSAAFFLGHYFNVAGEEFESKGPDQSFIASVRKFRH
jgi:hypothetical protein